MADIEFTSEIKLDTDKAFKSVASLASQIKHLFSDASSIVSSGIKSKNFGFSGVKDNYTAVLSDVQAMLNHYSAKYATQDEKPRNYFEALKYFNNLKKLTTIMDKLSPYDSLFGDVETLRTNIASGKVRHKAALGRYGVLQTFLNRTKSQYYKGYELFPDIFDESALKYVEMWRDLNRINGIEARASERFAQKEEYYDKSAERARNYLWYKGGLRELNDIFDLGLAPTSKRAPAKKFIDSKTFKENTEWIKEGFKAAGLRGMWDQEGLSPTEAKTYRQEYMRAMGKLIKGFEKAYPDQHEIAISLRRMRNEGLVTSGPGNGEPSPWQGLVSGGLLAWAAKQVVGAALDVGDTLIETYGNEKIQRNAYYSEKMHRERLKTYARAGGSVVGASIGGVIGGVVGAVPGALAGAGAGGWAGNRIAGMYPEWYKKEFESDIRSSTDVAAMARNHALYGYSYDTYFANALTEQGIANGEAAMGGLADRAMSLRARMMLGQVNEQEMLYMSMMPRYYAALMSGVTGPELLNVYQQDLANIGDPSMKYLVGQAIGNKEAFVAANSKYFTSFYGPAQRASSTYKQRTDQLEASFMLARGGMALETIGLQDKEIQDTYGRKNPMITVVVNLDGEEIKRASGQDDVYTDDMQLYTAGG